MWFIGEVYLWPSSKSLLLLLEPLEALDERMMRFGSAITASLMVAITLPALLRLCSAATVR